MSTYSTIIVSYYKGILIKRLVFVQKKTNNENKAMPIWTLCLKETGMEEKWEGT